MTYQAATIERALRQVPISECINRLRRAAGDSVRSMQVILEDYAVWLQILEDRLGRNSEAFLIACATLESGTNLRRGDRRGNVRGALEDALEAAGIESIGGEHRLDWMARAFENAKAGWAAQSRRRGAG